jgi:catechol 2,3-dioxygenase-like lactoylglutathione lyase family enzyme
MSEERDPGKADAVSRRPHYISGIDHVQIAVPEGQEQACRDFYLGILGLREIQHPERGAGRSFLWVRVGSQELHFRPDPDFAPARFAHPGFLVGRAETLAATLTEAGFEVLRDDAVASGRFHTRDPFGNRLEFIESGR